MDKEIKNTITNIFKSNLRIRKKERVLIFTDDFDKKVRDIAGLFKKVGVELYDKVGRQSPKIEYKEFPVTGSHGAEPPEALWVAAFGENTVKRLKSEGLFRQIIEKETNKYQLKKIEDIVKKFKKEAVNVVIALSYFSTTHTRFRDLLTNICGTRYASMPLFDIAMLKKAMNIDWKRMAERTRRLARRINKSDEIEIETPNGTHITFSKKGREAKTDTGILTKRGSLSNLPAGEVYLAPLEGTANGKLVLEWAPTHKLKKNITLYVENGMVKKIEGKDKYADALRKKLSERTENANIAELGIGTNDKASRPDNILESEKILGTIHIALGDNSSFGGKVRTPFHQDFVFFKPTVTLIYKDRKRGTLIKNGGLTK